MSVASLVALAEACGESGSKSDSTHGDGDTSGTSGAGESGEGGSAPGTGGASGAQGGSVSTGGSSAGAAGRMPRGGAAGVAGTLGTSGEGGAGDGGEGGSVSCDRVVDFSLALHSQAEVEAMRGVGTMTSSLEIAGNITDLTPLRCLTRGPSELTIADTTGLRSLRGLEGIGSIEGHLELRANGDLANLRGLSLESVGSLTIDGNPVLTDLNGLSSLTRVSGDVMLHRNETLMDITGLGSLVELGGRFSIRFQPRLRNLDGLENIERATAVVIEGNSILTSIEGLRGLHEVGGLYIDSNPVLASFDGLDALVSVTDQLWLFNNPMVATLAPLGNLTSAGSLKLDYMTTLDNLEGLENAEIQGDVSIHNNEWLTTTRGLNLASDGPGPFELGVGENPRLTSLEGFSGVSSTVGYVQVTTNDALTSLHGLEGIVSAANVEISWNGELQTLEGLDGLTTVSDFVTIQGNDSLASLEGLGSLREASLGLFGNPLLASADGLENLRTVHVLNVAENPTLLELRALAGVEAVTSDFVISGNVLLPTCEAVWLRDSVGTANIGGITEIVGNNDAGTCP